MIRVNLLPPEKRRRERTPISRVATLVVGTVLNAAIVLAMIWIGIDTKKIVDDTEAKNNDIKRLSATTVTADATKPCEYDAVKKEVDRMEARKKSIASIRTEAARGQKSGQPLLWSEVLDWVCDVVQGNQWVWLTALEAGEGAGARTKTPLDLYVSLSLNGSASEADCKANRVNEVQTSFKRDLWEKFKATPGVFYKEEDRKFPFNWADETFTVHPHEDPTHKEFIYLDYTATIGRGVPPKPR